jgi:hypothetical protein
VYINAVRDKVEIAVNGRRVSPADHVQEFHRAYQNAGGRGANADLLVGAKCTLATLWSFRGLLTGIGFNVRVYSFDESTNTMMEFRMDAPRTEAPKGAVPSPPSGYK